MYKEEFFTTVIKGEFTKSANKAESIKYDSMRGNLHMDRQSIIDKIKKEYIEPNVRDFDIDERTYFRNNVQVGDNENFKTLGLSSIDMIELVVKIEAEFNISISENEIVRINTIGDMADFIMKESKIMADEALSIDNIKKQLFGEQNEVV